MKARFMTTALLVLLLGLTPSCGSEEGPSSQPSSRAKDSSAPEDVDRAPPPALPDDAPKVVFLGDSLSAGMNLKPSEAFPVLLQRRLARQDRPFHLLNAGVSGSTTAAALARLDWVLKKPADIVVIQLGANDGFRGLSVEDSEKNLRAIIERVRQADARPLLLGMKLPPNYGPDYTRNFEAMFPRLAKELDVAYVPFFLDGVAGVAELNLSDGIHPNVEGHRRIASNLEQPLANILQDVQ